MKSFGKRSSPLRSVVKISYVMQLSFSPVKKYCRMSRKRPPKVRRFSGRLARGLTPDNMLRDTTRPL